MKKALFLALFVSALLIIPDLLPGKEVPKIAVGDLAAGNLTPSYAQDLTSILASEVSKLGKYEVYSQDNVRTLAGWTAERLTLGCTDTKCLTALGQMDIAKLISGRAAAPGSLSQGPRARRTAITRNRPRGAAISASSWLFPAFSFF